MLPNQRLRLPHGFGLCQKANFAVILQNESYCISNLQA